MDDLFDSFLSLADFVLDQFLNSSLLFVNDLFDSYLNLVDLLLDQLLNSLLLVDDLFDCFLDELLSLTEMSSEPSSNATNGLFDDFLTFFDMLFDDILNDFNMFLGNLFSDINMFLDNFLNMFNTLFDYFLSGG